MSHTRWDITDRDRAQEGYQETRRAHLFGKAARDRRTAPAMTQTQLAARAGMPRELIARPQQTESSPSDGAEPSPGEVADRVPYGSPYRLSVDAPDLAP